MPDLTDTEWHTVALGVLINDIKHLLEWLTIGLGCFAIASAIRTFHDYQGGDWLGFAWDLSVAVTFAASALGTSKRGRKYGKATR